MEARTYSYLYQYKVYCICIGKYMLRHTAFFYELLKQKHIYYVISIFESLLKNELANDDHLTQHTTVNRKYIGNHFREIVAFIGYSLWTSLTQITS